MVNMENFSLSDSVRAAYCTRYPELAEKISIFDLAIYFNSNPDVAAVSKSAEGLIQHFINFGHRECRLYAPGVTYKALFSAAYPHLAARLEAFEPRDYLRANQDVADQGSAERHIYQHYCDWGANELRALRNDGHIIDRRYALEGTSGVGLNYDLRVYTHVFLPEIGRTLRPYLTNLAATGAHIAFSFSKTTFSQQEMEDFAAYFQREQVSSSSFLAPPNDGLGWGGFYALWQQFPPSEDSAVFFLHSKKSRHMAPIVGEMWLNELLGPICGSYGMIFRAIEKLNAGYSMVGSQLHKSRNVGSSREIIDEILPRLKIKISADESDFVAGTMFAIRGDVLNEFFQLLTGAIDFSRRSKGATMFDGTMAHACERLIGYFASTRGKGIAWVI